MIDTRNMVLIKKAELLSSFGAGILGGGIALLLVNMLAGYAFPILLLGFISHSVGMFQKHQLEQGRHARIWWAESLYWLCWLALAVSFVYVVIRQL